MRFKSVAHPKGLSLWGVFPGPFFLDSDVSESLPQRRSPPLHARRHGAPYERRLIVLLWIGEKPTLGNEIRPADVVVVERPWPPPRPRCALHNQSYRFPTTR